MSSNLTYNCKPFNSLRLDELYAILALRQEIFVVEQNCPYQDADNKDQHSFHVMVHKDSTLIAYARLVPIGLSYKNYCSIGRVVTAKNQRGKGIGKLLMSYALKQCNKLFPNIPIKISAQVYILNFYSDLGFSVVGEEYLEDDIPHRAMVHEQNN